MEQFNAGWISLLPPCITILLALRTKEIISSLFIGLLGGTLVYTIGMDDGPYALKTVEVALTLIVS